jgi:WD40 repeat protein
MEFQYDGSISYSRKDKIFAQQLQISLEQYKPPKDLPVPQRRLKIFRDEADLTGPDYYRAIDEHLGKSCKLIVICSPAARASEFVNDEIRRFAGGRGALHIIPVLILGSPNNEVRAGWESDMAFPEELCAALELPLAIDYRAWDGQADLTRGSYENSWYRLLSELYGISRAEVEQRENIKRAQDRVTLSDQLVAAALNSLAGNPELATLLAIEAASVTRRADSVVTRAAEEILHRCVLNAKLRRTAPLLTIEAHKGACWNARYSPDGARIATSGEDGYWRLWDAASGDCLLKSDYELVPVRISMGIAYMDTWDKAPKSPVKCIAFSPDGKRVVTGHWDGLARLWSVQSGGVDVRLEGHEGYVWHATFSLDGQRVATAGVDGTARVWDAVSGQLQQTLIVAPESVALLGRIAPVTAVAFSPDGARLATAGSDGVARVWEIASGRQVLTLRGHTAAVQHVAFHPDGTRLATSASDASVRIWSASTGEELRRIASATPEFLWVSFHCNGAVLATANRDKTAEAWDIASGRKVFSLVGHKGGVWCVDYNPDSKRLLTSSYDGTAKIWDASPREEGLAFLRGHNDTVNGMSFSPDGARVVTASWDKTTRVWEVDTARELAVTVGSGPLMSVSFAPQGETFSVAGDAGVSIHDASSGKELIRLHGHSAAVLCAVFSPDGRRLVTASYDRTAKIWDAASGREELTFTGHSAQLLFAAFSPDGSRVVTCSKDHTARVWDAASGRTLAVLRGHQHPVNGVAFSPKGTRIATASEDNTAMIWDSDTGTALMTLTGHVSLLTAVAFSPDGRRVATASLDKTVKLWPLDIAAEPVTLYAHEDEVWGLAFSVDGKRLGTCGKGGAAMIHTLDLDDLLAFAVTCAGRELTASERSLYLGT